MSQFHRWNVKFKTLLYWTNNVTNDAVKRRAVLDLFWHILDAKPSYLRRYGSLVDVCTRRLHTVFICHREDVEVKEVVCEWKARFGCDPAATPQIGCDTSMPKL